MKVCKLGVKNITSFWVEPVELDFENGPLADTSLVAITGPTGSGKTTLFDAICVALYGKTPRLDGIGDRHPRSLLSHNKSDGHAEVIFETNRIRYLAEWSIKRGGAPRRQLIRVGTGDKIADGGQVTEKITAILGLDFDAFRRSIMLAQGDFAAFLKAQPKEKLQILEATADIGIYDDLQGALNDKMTAVRDDLKTVLGKLPPILEGVNLPELTDARGVLRDLDAVLGRRSDPGEIGNKFVSRNLDAILGVLREKVSEEKETLCRFQEELERANQLLTAKKDYDTAKSDRDQAEAELHTAETARDAAKNQRDQRRADFDASDAAYRTVFADQQEKVPVYTAAAFDVKRAQDRFSQADALVPKLEELDEQIGTLSNQLTEYGARQTELAGQIQAAVKFIAANPLPADRQKRLNLRDLAVLVNPIKELRQKLEDSEPCLVCGATEHPHAHEIASEREPAPDHPLWDAIPADLRELGLTLEEAFDQLVKRINAVEAREDELRTKRNQLALLVSDISANRANLERAEEQRKSVHANIERYQREGNAFLDAASEKTGGLTTEAEIHAAIENLNADLQVKAELRYKAEQALRDSETLLAKAQTKYNLCSSRLAECETKLETARTAYLEKLTSAGFTSPVKGTLSDPEELARITAKLAEIEEKLPKNDDIVEQLAVITNLENALSNFKDSAKAVRKAYEEFTRWNKLRLAIAYPRPGALGKFALRVVLEQVSQFANAQLEYLTSGRYQLKVESIDKLSVIDRWNANEERPVETLSGGESFLTSFALALGLSEISRGRAEIGSLFLDEGFGTLDAETLDIVIDALQRLRLQGRSIFLISHIERLTKHLPAEIRVEKEINAGSTVDVG